MSAATEFARPADETDTRHAARMDATYALQRHIYDWTRKYYLLGRDLLIDGLDVPPEGHVLEIGCGTARNLAFAAERFPDVSFYGLDISAEMLKSAEAKLRKEGVAERCTLACADATGFDPQLLFGRKQFDRIFASYTLSMIPGWDRALEANVALLAPGGELHVVDFGQQQGLPRWFGIALRTWLARFHVTPRAGLFMICEELAARHGLTCETRSLYRDYARMVVLRRP